MNLNSSFPKNDHRNYNINGDSFDVGETFSGINFHKGIKAVKELKTLLFRACETGMFNKISDVKYDQESGIIESFKHLEFNENTKKYKLKTGGTKSRSVSKSRSNLDRLMKKK